MNQTNQKQFAGVWLDSAKAIIFTNPSEDRSEYTIQEKVIATENNGGGSEHSINNTKHADVNKYYKSVSAQLVGFDEIFIFGPGQSQEQFQNHLNSDSHFKSRRITIDSSDQMTEPQMIAKVREFFKNR